jgi:predicted RNA-binding Zn ribbon-like protein
MGYNAPVAAEHRFELIAGHLALDFVNTVDWRGDPERRRDLIDTFDDLLAFARQVGAVGAGEVRGMAAAAARDQHAAERHLRRARRLREVLARLLAAAGRHARPEPRDVRVLNAFVAAARQKRRLEPRGIGFTWVWLTDDEANFSRMLWPIVLAAADLLTSDQRVRIHECAGNGCGWLFLDTSRNQRRRWCNMQGCGNRAKARRFYARTRTEM